MKETPLVDARPRRRNSFGNISKEDLEAKARAAGFDNIADYNYHLYRSSPIRCQTLSTTFRHCLRTNWSDADMCDIYERALVFDCGDEKEATGANMREKAAIVALKFKSDSVDGLRTRPSRRDFLLEKYDKEECAREENKKTSRCNRLRGALLSDFNVNV